MLTSQELERYSRQIMLTDVGQSGQVRLKNSRVLCVGAGGLGNAVVRDLSTSGVGHLVIYDADVVERSNLARQPLFTENDIGRQKVQVLAEFCRRQNPDTKIETVTAMIAQANCEEAFQHVDVVVDCADNAETSYFLNDQCLARGIPLVTASMAQWSGYCLLVDGPGCYRCVFPDENAVLPTCQGQGVISSLPSLLGAVQASCVLQCLLKKEQSWRGKLFRCDLAHMQFETLERAVDESCSVCGVQANHQAHHPLNQAELGLMTVDRLQSLLSRGDQVSLLDVRTYEERSEAHIGGVHIPLDELAIRYQELDQSKHWVVYCRSGMRSDSAARFLYQQGFQYVSNLSGGLLAYSRASV